MPIEDLKTWHWIIIGALAGLIMGYVFSLAGPPRNSTWRIPISNEMFVDRIGEDSPGRNALQIAGDSCAARWP